MTTTTLLLLCLAHLAISVTLAIRLRSLGRDLRGRITEQRWLIDLAHQRCDRRRSEISSLEPVVEQTRETLAAYRVRMTAMEGLPSRVVDVERLALGAVETARQAFATAADLSSRTPGADQQAVARLIYQAATRIAAEAGIDCQPSGSPLLTAGEATAPPDTTDPQTQPDL